MAQTLSEAGHPRLLAPAFRAAAHVLALPACSWLAGSLPGDQTFCLFALFAVAFEMTWSVTCRLRLALCVACAVGLVVSGFFLVSQASAVRDAPARATSR